MAVISEVLDLIPALRGQCSGVASTLPIELDALDDDTVTAALAQATALANQIEQVRLAASGVIAARSARAAGHSGLAQSRGHRTAQAMIQDVTGSTRAEANRMARVGAALRADSAADARDDSDHEEQSDKPEGALPTGDERTTHDDTDERTAPRPSWHAPLSRAVLDGAITAAQHDVIRRGLGEPPAIDAASLDSPEDAARLQETWREAWEVAAEQLIVEAAARTVEELSATARLIRDRLDPEGAAARFQARYERRSFRMWVDADGLHHGSMIFDDEGAALLRTIHDAALRPRRGGPRFKGAEERAAAQDRCDDPRTNDQLAHDLLIDLLRAGAYADVKTVFGTRQAGVRIVQTADDQATDDQGSHTSAHTEDGLVVVDSTVADKHACDAGVVPVTVDGHGNPLDVGREQRLFTPKQRIALAIRDGGCRWRGCDRPASYCESHHIDHWADGGRTDLDRGILLCRFHHLQLHNGGWSISRAPDGEFVLHHRSGDSVTLPRRLALRYAFDDIGPPRRQFRPAA